MHSGKIYESPLVARFGDDSGIMRSVEFGSEYGGEIYSLFQATTQRRIAEKIASALSVYGRPWETHDIEVIGKDGIHIFKSSYFNHVRVRV